MNMSVARLREQKSEWVKQKTGSGMCSVSVLDPVAWFPQATVLLGKQKSTPSPQTRVTVDEEASNEDTRAGNHLTHGVLRAHHLIGGRGEAQWFTQGHW